LYRPDGVTDGVFGFEGEAQQAGHGLREQYE
jgi:hypothetical protein